MGETMGFTSNMRKGQTPLLFERWKTAVAPAAAVMATGPSAVRLLLLLLPRLSPSPRSLPTSKNSPFAPPNAGGVGCLLIQNSKKSKGMWNCTTFGFFLFLLFTPPSPASPHFSPSAIPNDGKPALFERRRKRLGPKATLERGRPLSV